MASQISLMDSFSINLGQSVHQYAEQYCQSHSNIVKAEEVYLNTLSIWAVSNYLTLLGYSTDLSTSDSHDIVMRLVTDVAALRILQFGQVECRRLLSNDKVMRVPPEVWTDRIAYIAVQLDNDLTQAQILGFVSRVNEVTVGLDRLRPLNELTVHLNQFEPIDLKQWFQDKFQPGWQKITEILRPDQYEIAPAVRGSEIAELPRDVFRSVERGCKVKFGDQQAMAMVVSLKQADQQTYNISVELWPADSKYLPDRLQLSILDEVDDVVMDIQTREDNQKVEMKFDGEPGDCFGIRISGNDASITKSFILE